MFTPVTSFVGSRYFNPHQSPIMIQAYYATSKCLRNIALSAISAVQKWFGLQKLKKQMNRKKILAGSKNIKFFDMVNLVKGFGFNLSRTDGSHHIFARPNIPELVNLQNLKG